MYYRKINYIIHCLKDLNAMNFSPLDYVVFISYIIFIIGLGLWVSRDMAVGLSYAANLTDRFSIGGTMKYISQEIWH